MEGYIQKGHKTERDNGTVVAWDTTEDVTFAAGKCNRGAVSVVTYLHSNHSQHVDVPALT